MTQRELAGMLSLSVNSVSMYERGLSTPSDEVKLELARIFHVSLDYLMGNTDGEAFGTGEPFRTPSGEHSEIMMMKSLSPEAQAEVEGFIEYLKEKYHIDCVCYTVV